MGGDSLVGAFSKEGWTTVHTYLIELALILQLYPAKYDASGETKVPSPVPNWLKELLQGAAEFAGDLKGQKIHAAARKAAPGCGGFIRSRATISRVPQVYR